MNLVTLTPAEYWVHTQSYWRAASKLLGLSIVDPLQFTQNNSGLTYYLREVGVLFTNGREVTTPNHPDKAEALGYDFFILPNTMWLVYGVQLTVFDRLRRVANSPVRIRNVWRPRDYNLKVSSAPYSDHVWGCGMDLDFKTLFARRRASKLVQSFWATEAFQLSVGTGRRTIHLGMFAPQTLKMGKQRQWKYGR